MYKEINIANNAFSFENGHSFLSSALLDIASNYAPNCFACNQEVMTGTARKLANSTLIQDIPASAKLSVTPMKRFMTIYFTHIADSLWPEEPVSFDEWKNIFANSSAIHINNKMSQNLVVTDDPKYCAYALLRPKLCPLAYYSTSNF